MSDEQNTEMDNNEWLVDFWKGGAGSGEHPGHPFRGNRYTGGVQSAEHHEWNKNGRSNFRGSNHGEHLSAAHSRIAAARAAMSHGEYGLASHHFNETAFHAAQASKQLQEPGGFTNHELGQQAEALYHAAHHAGDAAERASKATNDVARGRAMGVNPETAATLNTAATNARAMADNTATMAEHASTTVNTSRTLVGDPTVRQAMAR